MTREAVEAALEAGVEVARELLGNVLYLKEELPNVDLPAAVSYTHLTMPTKRIV